MNTTTSGARRMPSGPVMSLVAGVACILAGLSMLGFAGWQYYGTDVIARHTQAQLRDELRARWKYPTQADVLGPQAAVTALGSAEALVRVPRFGQGYELPLIEGVRGEDLREGIGHFPGTGPGQIGNFVLAGHRVQYGDPFGRMDELRPGDEVIIETSDVIYTYALDTNPNALVVPFNQAWVLSDVPRPPSGKAPAGLDLPDSTKPTRALITLTSCSELFHSHKRMVAFGHLITTQAK